jgi:class 3 adenylate cyclase
MSDIPQNSKVFRRRAAILAANIADYCVRISADEGAPVRDLKPHPAVILPMVGEHVRVIQTAGDGILAEFGSIFDTVECAPIIRASNFCGPLFRSRFVRK